jgi:hypothetical protein
VKFSFISATSIIALFSASLGAAHAGALNAASSPSNIYDLVHDGMTSSDGGDNTVTSQDLSVSAVVALEASTQGWQTAGSTGRIERVAAGYPKIPLGAAQGTKPDEDLASAASGLANTEAPVDPRQKAYEIGQARVASLVGTIGNGPSAKDKTGSTVFVADGTKLAFNDGGEASGPGGPSSAFAFAPSSTSTATITVAGAGNLSRQWAGNGSYAVAANSLQIAPPTDDAAPKTVAMSDATETTLGYSYAPAATTIAKGNAVEASFSDAVTATGNMAQVITPAYIPRVQTSQLQPSTLQTDPLRGRSLQPGQSVGGKPQGRPDQFMTSQIQRSQFQSLEAGKTQVSQVEAIPGRRDQFLTSQIQKAQFQFVDPTASGRKVSELVPTMLTPTDDPRVDGTRTMISTSVSSNPSETAAAYMASTIRQTPTSPTAHSTVEAFEVGPTPGTKTEANAGTVVADPLGSKILASAGPLNSSLALP